MKTFADLLDEFGVRYKRHGESSKVTAGWLGMPCPFCHHVPQGGDLNILGVNLRTGSISCWYCGTHKPGETLAALTGRPLGECVQLTRDTGRRGPIPERTAGVYQPPAALAFAVPMHPAHAAYLRDRGFDPDAVARLWRISCIGVSATHPWSIFIPIFHQDEPVSWTTRTIGDVGRYVGAKAAEEKLPAKSLLYGEDYARTSIVVTEGPTKTWAGGPGFVGTMGTGFTRAQVRRISRYPRRAIAFDMEPTAQERARALANELEPLDGETWVVRLESAAELDKAHPDERAAIRKRFLE